MVAKLLRLSIYHVFLPILHTRLRNYCSSLNNDLFRNHVRDNPLCEWSGLMEDATH